jgi:hypothetical protein
VRRNFFVGFELEEKRKKSFFPIKKQSSSTRLSITRIILLGRRNSFQFFNRAKASPGEVSCLKSDLHRVAFYVINTNSRRNARHWLVEVASPSSKCCRKKSSLTIPPETSDAKPVRRKAENLRATFRRVKLSRYRDHHNLCLTLKMPLTHHARHAFDDFIFLHLSEPAPRREEREKNGFKST